MTATQATTRKSTAPSVADDPRWARIVARDKTADGQLLVFGFDDGRLLPAVVSLAHRQSEERAAPRQSRERQGDRLPAVPALQPGGRLDRRRECGPGGEGVPDHRGKRGGALAGGTGEAHSVAARATFIACSRPSPGSRRRTMPPPTARRRSAGDWPAATASPRRSTTRASIPADVSMRGRRTCSA